MLKPLPSVTSIQKYMEEHKVDLKKASEEMGIGYYRAWRLFKKYSLTGHYVAGKHDRPTVRQCTSKPVKQSKDDSELSAADKNQAAESAANPKPHIASGPVDEEAAPPAERNPNDLLFQGDYTFNPVTDTYLTWIPGQVKPIHTSGDMHRGICRSYSNLEGDEATINELAREFEFPRPWMVQYLKAHGITHDKEPFSNEEMRDRTTEDLVEETLQRKRLSFHRSLEKAKWQKTVDSAHQWDVFEESIMRPLLAHIEENAPRYRPPVLRLPSARSPFALVHGAADLHFGKSAWVDQIGQSYSREECTELLKEHTQVIVENVKAYGRPEKIIFPVSNDWFHVDNWQGGTTYGTRQDMDGTAAQMVIEGSDLAVQHIDMLRQLGCPIELHSVICNHSRILSVTLMKFLQGWYRNDKDVTISLLPRVRQYNTYGNNLLCFSHGEEVNRAALSAAMTNEERVAWGQTQNHVAFTGHLHFEETKDTAGVTVYQMPSLTAADDWHSSKAYISSRRALTAYVIDKQRGVTAELVSPIVGDFLSGVKQKDLKSFQRAA